jgi:hypothetical protein
MSSASAVTQRQVPFDLIPLIRVYDLRHADGWRQAHLHRRLWGRLHVDAFPLDDDHVLLVFSSKGPRWERWERLRLAWILADGRSQDASREELAA